MIWARITLKEKLQINIIKPTDIEPSHYHKNSVTRVTFGVHFVPHVYLLYKLRKYKLYIVVFCHSIYESSGNEISHSMQRTTFHWKLLSYCCNCYSLHCTWNTELDFSSRSGFYMPIVHMIHTLSQFSCLPSWDTNGNISFFFLLELVVW
jgi:hypothetical protein